MMVMLFAEESQAKLDLSATPTSSISPLADTVIARFTRHKSLEERQAELNLSATPVTCQPRCQR